MNMHIKPTGKSRYSTYSRNTGTRKMVGGPSQPSYQSQTQSAMR